METWMQTGVGILVSVGLFLFTYRQTWGASRERARAATDELAAGLMRLLVDEGRIVSGADVSAMMDAQARRHRVGRSFMPSTEQLRGLVMARLLLLEYVPQANKAELMSLLAVTPDDALTSASEGEAARETARHSSMLQVLSGVASVVAGTAAVALASSQTITSLRLDVNAVLSIVVSATAVLVAFLIIRSRSGDAVTPHLPDMERQADHALRDLLDTMEIKYRVGGPSDGYDYMIWLGAAPTVVELKHARKGRTDARRLALAAKEESAERAILVVASKNGCPVEPGVECVTFKEFLRLLRPPKTDAA